MSIEFSMIIFARILVYKLIDYYSHLSLHT